MGRLGKKVSSFSNGVLPKAVPCRVGMPRDGKCPPGICKGFLHTRLNLAEFNMVR